MVKQPGPQVRTRDRSREGSRPRLLLRVAALLVLASGIFVGTGSPIPAGAVTAPTFAWTPTGIEPRAGGVMAFDEAHGQAVLFGGSGFESGSLRDTWTWDGSQWIPRNPAHKPAPRGSPAMAYDAANDNVVLFGGNSDECPPDNLCNDTWTWDGADWTKQSPAHSPPARESSAMTYDAGTGKVLLFGGFGDTRFTDTWTWDGTDWTNLNPANHPVSTGADDPMVYDAGTGTVVMLTTTCVSGPPLTCFSDTWTWDGTDWNDLGPSAPPARTKARMVYDSANDVVVLFGGSIVPRVSASYRLDDTWTWNGTDWTEQTPAHSPSARLIHSMAYDPVHQKVLLFGGCCDISPGPYGGTLPSTMGDWWTWDGTDWTQEGVSTTPPSRQFPSMAYDAARREVIVFGGTASNAGSRDDTWTWDGGTWTQQTPLNHPTWRGESAMAYDAERQETVLFGGVNDEDHGDLFDETWTWDGSDWTKENPAHHPSAREGARAVYSPHDHAVVLFGGNPCNSFCDDTWTWDGTDWTKQNPAHSPSPRAYFSMTYDAARGDVVLFGGENCDNPPTGLCDDTWTWDGSDWTQPVPATRPPHREWSAMAYDPTNQDVVLFSGLGCSNDSGMMCPNDTWIWDGQDWTQSSLAVSPPARCCGAMTFDSNGHAFMFGGYVQDPGVVSGTFSFGPKPAIVRVLGKSGGTVVTPNSVGATHPLKTSVALENTDAGGAVSIAQITPTETPPPGIMFLKSEAAIMAPKGTPASPLTLVFTLDASLVAVDPGAPVKVFRAEGTSSPVQVPACATPGVLGPDPCVSEQTPTGGGGVQITVLTTSASAWNFGFPGVSLTASKTGTGSGMVTSQPWGVSCGLVCRAGYNSGTAVILNAVPDHGSVFTHWSRDCTGTRTCKVTMAAPHHVTATFVHKPDATIKSKSDRSYKGDGVYNTTARRQTRKIKARRGATKTFLIGIRDRGSSADTFRLKGLGSTRKFQVEYLAGKKGGTNITSAVKHGSYRLKVRSARIKYIRMRITVRSSAPVGSVFGGLVKAKSIRARTAVDAVEGAVKVS